LKTILIKYGELNTKKDNIKYFINKLEKSMKKKFSDLNVNITSNVAHSYIEYHEEDELKVIDRLSKIPGIYSFTIANKTKTDIDNIKEEVKNIIQNINFNTFKIDTKRSYKDFNLKSPEINNILGGVVLKNKDNVKVDVHNPELKLTVEIREKYTYIYSIEYLGLGGYPEGVNGKSLVMLSGGIDSPVSCFEAIKKGIIIECVYFEAIPHTSLNAREKVINLIKKLEEYTTYDIKLHIINFTNIQEMIYKYCDKTYTITIMRRHMYRISELLCKKIGATSIINGESIGQVASQTQESILTINSTINYPVFRPCAFMDKKQIIDISKKIDTYDISILPYEDCCTIFVPDHPVIRPNINKAKEEEENFDYNKEIDNIMNNILEIIVKKEETTFNDYL